MKRFLVEAKFRYTVFNEYSLCVGTTSPYQMVSVGIKRLKFGFNEARNFRGAHLVHVPFYHSFQVNSSVKLVIELFLPHSFAMLFVHFGPEFFHYLESIA